MKSEDIIKIIDGEVYYHYDYTDYLYNIINKAIKYIEDNLYPVGNDVNGSDLPYDEAIQPLLDILKGE